VLVSRCLLVAYRAGLAGQSMSALPRYFRRKDKVDTNTMPIMGTEDFSYMLNARPGALMFIGNGDGPSAHNPNYDFNDEIIPLGCSYWARVVEMRLT
jgi:metal-dependent amidase/aminoacylase/carboxypeptidase family protein